MCAACYDVCMARLTLSDKIKQVFADSSTCTWREFDVKVARTCDPSAGDDFEVTVSQMYQYVEVTFDVLKRLSKLFGTTKINVGNYDFTSGCESCDYGSDYTVTIYVKNAKPGIRLD